MMTPEHLKKEAERLVNDPVLIQALKDLRDEALADLVLTDAADVNQIIANQQKAKLAEEILNQLQRYILAIDDEETAP